LYFISFPIAFALGLELLSDNLSESTNHSLQNTCHFLSYAIPKGEPFAVTAGDDGCETKPPGSQAG
jgi:hypothetical protein